MSRVLTVARREFAAYFNSPIANVFLLAFAGVCAFTFFNLEGFFARGIADLRGLFGPIPALMLVLVPALTMRLWAEERKSGTVEILLTLPASKAEIVAGKFLASWMLLTFALALTLPLALTAGLLGDVDWGPVAGGYIGAMLLGATYLAIGQFVSATTENQILAFIAALLICAAVFGVGTEAFGKLFSDDMALLLRSLGTGSRFESVSRGVIDLRDLAYYASLSLAFLIATVSMLEIGRAPRPVGVTLARNRKIALVAVLAALNLLAANVLLSRLTGARLDLTADKRFTMSGPTLRVLATLDEPIHVTGYFSKRTHPKLAPLIPEITDALAEYAARSGGRLRYQVLNPEESSAVERDAVERFDVRSQPFRFASKYEASIVNAWFALVIRFGDEYQKYDVADLIEVVPSGDGDVDIRLRNLEYDLTRAIRRLTTQVRKETDLLKSFERPVRLTTLMTPDELPSRFSGLPAIIREAAIEMQVKSGGRFKYIDAVPETTAGAIERNTRAYGVSPMRSGYPEREGVFYLYALLQIGDQVEQIHIANESLTKEKFRQAVQSALRRNAPGFVQTVGIFSPDPAISRQALAQFDFPGKMMPAIRMPEFENVQRLLAREYDVVIVNLRAVERVPDDVDVLLVVEPRNLTDQEVFKIDQFLMRGGKVIICAGNYDLEVTRDFNIREIETGLDDWLAHFGIEVERTLVLDDRNQPLPIPQLTRTITGPRETWAMMPYPYLIRVEGDGFANRDVAGRLRSIGLYWASPLNVTPSANADAEVLPILQSSRVAWTDSNLENVRRPTYTVPEVTSPRLLGVALDGTFRSYWADRPPPEHIGNPDLMPLRAVASRSPATRLVVIGNSEFVSDLVAQAFGSSLAGFFNENLRFVQNVIDWTTVDSEMVAIRSRRSEIARLPEIGPKKRITFEAINYVAPLFAILVIAVVRGSMRRRAKPVTGGPAQ